MKFVKDNCSKSKLKTDFQCMIHLIQHCLIQVTDLILQPSFVDRPQLLQKDHRIPLDSIGRRIDLNMCRQFRFIHL